MRKMLLGSFVLLSAFAMAKVPSADSILAAAHKEAGASRTTLVMFHASWCGWCKRLDAFLADKEVKPIIAKYFVPVHLTVLERADKKSLENPGAEALYKKWTGTGQAGLPFMVVLDGKSKVVGDSYFEEGGKKQNTGFPAVKPEVDAFLKMLRAGAAKMTGAEETILRTRLGSYAPESRPH